MEISNKVHPGKLLELLEQSIFSFSNVPYRIKSYTDMLGDPFATITFDRKVDDEVTKRVQKFGTDGRLVLNLENQVFHVTMLEKILTLLLAKMANFVPDGGIWMNTQRPEWNDANNALVGKGLSVVTMGYLRKFIVFVQDLLQQTPVEKFHISIEVKQFFTGIQLILSEYAQFLDNSTLFDPINRKKIMDDMGKISSDYRLNFYTNGFSGDFSQLDKKDLLKFLSICREFIEHSLKVNKRPDQLYNAYNILHVKSDKATISNLDEMLEGQVSILASGLLTGDEAASLLKTLRESKLFRPDQHSYILYPDRNLPGFLRKNSIPKEKVQDSRLVAVLLEKKDQTLIVQDTQGQYHFCGDFKNARDLTAALNKLKLSELFKPMVEEEEAYILELFETLFNHNAFTGRSGTFFAYEGLGSIYWHMVSKLLLATQENYWHAIASGAKPEIIQLLREDYYDIRLGLGFNKQPEIYGAFPTDPYSHTPAKQGAKQPGVTGQVKEEILTRLRELGIFIKEGRISFDTSLLNVNERLSTQQIFHYVDVAGTDQEITLEPGSYAFTFCQVPVLVSLQTLAVQKIRIDFSDHQSYEIDGSTLDAETSKQIFQRTNLVKQITFITRMERTI